MEVYDNQEDQEFPEPQEVCIDCGTPMIEKREDRGNGLVEYVLYCENCGLCMT